MRLSEWVRQHDGIVFQFPTQDFDRYELESNMAQEEEDHEAHNDMKLGDEDDDDDDDDDTISLLEP